MYTCVYVYKYMRIYMCMCVWIEASEKLMNRINCFILSPNIYWAPGAGPLLSSRDTIVKFKKPHTLQTSEREDFNEKEAFE